MKTSDKELDDLFTSKLHDFEVEPAANLWQNISTELDRKPKRKSIVLGLRIAAGILIVLSAGLLLLLKNEPAKTNLPKKVAKVVLQKIDPNINQIASLGDKKSTLLLSVKNKVIKEASPKKGKSKVIVTKPTIVQKPENELISIQTSAQNKPEAEPVISKNNAVESRVALVPDVSVSLKPQPEIEVPIKTVVKPSMFSSENNTVKVKHKRIRSIGDVVNLVMAKVDKRQDKLIQFSDADDGEESNVTGINLGIISIKKEK